MSLKIVAVCPAGAVTGGPEAIHQLVDMCNRVLDGSSAICYIPDAQNHDVPEPYKKYATPVVRKDDIPNDAIVVIPELWPFMVNDFSQDCAFWWLSVDNFVCGDISVLDKYKYHLAQSEYAYEYVPKTYGKTISMLSDYINLSTFSGNSNKKIKQVLVNPAKGLELIDLFEKQNQNIKMQRIQGMPPNAVAETFASSALYIDFGHHPGRDRMPREAAILGCVVMVRRAGAASYFKDAPIDDIYKFSTIEDASHVAREILENYELHYEAQKEYREWVLNQEKMFEIEVSEFLSLISDTRRD